MKKLTGFLALSLLSIGIITAQNEISNATTAINGDVMKTQLQSTDNAVATDGDIIIIDRRKRKGNIVDTEKLNASVQNADNAIATDGDIIIIDRRKRKGNIVDTEKLNASVQNADNAIAT
ncbi:MAG TPA: hypothetical protein VLZ54_00380, partial [Arenibacter sp.]|nr:hypothetical protein [Arenibacter sp.]